MKRFFPILLLAILANSAAPTKNVNAADASLTELVKVLVSTTDWRALTPKTSGNLQIWDRPGVVWVPAARLTPEDVKTGRADQHLKELLDITFARSEIVPGVPQPAALADGPIVPLKSAKQHDYRGECERPKDFEGKWFTVPGDYLAAQCRAAAQDEQDKKGCSTGTEPAPTLTLIYHHKEQSVPMPKDKKIVDPFGNPMQRLFDGNAGNNYYFGVIKENGAWKLKSFGMDADCDA